jgi:hypothetical protein
MVTAPSSFQGSAASLPLAKTARHYFCRTCGIYPFHRKRITPDNLGINVHCLEDFDPSGIPVRQAFGAAMD